MDGVIQAILLMAVAMAVDLFMVCFYFDVLYTNSYVVFVRYACCYLYHVFYFHDNLLVKLCHDIREAL
jgi:ABC-type transport system involved in Fe-S cluster assembly fused permease/ATPase subunit